jgi:hypothetical protein
MTITSPRAVYTDAKGGAKPPSPEKKSWQKGAEARLPIRFWGTDSATRVCQVNRLPGKRQRLSFSVPVGTTNGTNCLVISENSGESGADPYGHIHGREFTTSAPGTYTVGFRVIDICTNGLGGGPIQSPSDVLSVRFQAGLRIESIQSFINRVAVSFRSPPGISNLLETTDSTASSKWLPVATPLRGNNNLQSFTDTNAPIGNRWYRIRQLNNLP